MNLLLSQLPCNTVFQLTVSLFLNILIRFLFTVLSLNVARTKFTFDVHLNTGNSYCGIDTSNV